jgi:Kef-type K+ transport system membrane component KefB
MASTFNEAALLILVFEIGAVIIFSLVAAKVLGKRGIPQVLGLIIGGITLQFLSFYTQFPTPPTPEIHYIVTTGALGFIGYSIGAHLDLRKLFNESWGLILLLLGQSIIPFILVFITITVVFNTIFLYSMEVSIIIGLLSGSIAMATAPASTAEVIREYRALGTLSQTILFIIAFDDILAIIFFNISLSYSESILSGVGVSFVESIILPIGIELIGSAILGIILAFAMYPFHFEGTAAYQSAEFVFPSVLICMAVAGLLHLSVVLSCIVFGLTLSNLARCENAICVRGVERLSTPIIALFFILVGFEMDLGLLFTPILLGIMAYFFARFIGKSLGSYVSAAVAGMESNVKNNIPFALITQAGVAIGLAAFAVTRLSALGTVDAIEIAAILLDLVAVNVLIAEIIGPILLKKAIFKAGENDQAHLGSLF